jgi:hypothetical protein
MPRPISNPPVAVVPGAGGQWAAVHLDAEVPTLASMSAFTTQATHVAFTLGRLPVRLWLPWLADSDVVGDTIHQIVAGPIFWGIYAPEMARTCRDGWQAK